MGTFYRKNFYSESINLINYATKYRTYRIAAAIT